MLCFLSVLSSYFAKYLQAQSLSKFIYLQRLLNVLSKPQNPFLPIIEDGSCPFSLLVYLFIWYCYSHPPRFKKSCITRLHVSAEMFRLGRPEQVWKEECANNYFVLTKTKWANLWFSAWMVSGIKSSILFSHRRKGTIYHFCRDTKFTLLLLKDECWVQPQPLLWLPRRQRNKQTIVSEPDRPIHSVQAG